MSPGSHIRPWHLTAGAALVCGGFAGLGWDDGKESGKERQDPSGRVAERIVAASVSSAEILLGLVPHQRIAAVHYLVADPVFSTVANEVGGIKTIGASPEQILSVRPDLVLTDEYTSAVTQRLLGTIGVPLLRIDAPRNFDDVARNLELVGARVGGEAQANAQASRLRARIQELGDERATVSSWRIMNLNGDLDTYGRDSLFDAAVNLAGARNIPADRGADAYLKLDIETVMAWRPDALVVASEPTWIESDPVLSLLPCVQRKRYIRVSSALLSCQSSRAVELAARIQEQLRAWGNP
ncbi:MAG: ABC transporter substrate-binding protein [Planctomycetota bacterium]|nr:ABC transporter substrate-binding protein [Planctomycetota bacterium]